MEKEVKKKWGRALVTLGTILLTLSGIVNPFLMNIYATKTSSVDQVGVKVDYPGGKRHSYKTLKEFGPSLVLTSKIDQKILLPKLKDTVYLTNKSSQKAFVRRSVAGVRDKNLKHMDKKLKNIMKRYKPLTLNRVSDIQTVQDYQQLQNKGTKEKYDKTKYYTLNLKANKPASLAIMANTDKTIVLQMALLEGKTNQVLGVQKLVTLQHSSKFSEFETKLYQGFVKLDKDYNSSMNNLAVKSTNSQDNNQSSQAQSDSSMLDSVSGRVFSVGGTDESNETSANSNSTGVNDSSKQVVAKYSSKNSKIDKQVNKSDTNDNKEDTSGNKSDTNSSKSDANDNKADTSSNKSDSSLSNGNNVNSKFNSNSVETKDENGSSSSVLSSAGGTDSSDFLSDEARNRFNSLFDSSKTVDTQALKSMSKVDEKSTSSLPNIRTLATTFAASTDNSQVTDESSTAVHGQKTVYRDLYADSSGNIVQGTTNAPNIRMTVKLSKVQTGKAPFDDTDGNGKDSSADNDIVRINDNLTYTWQVSYTSLDSNAPTKIQQMAIQPTPATDGTNKADLTFNGHVNSVGSWAYGEKYASSIFSIPSINVGAATVVVTSLNPSFLPNNFILPMNFLVYSGSSYNKDKVLLNLTDVNPITISSSSTTTVKGQASVVPGGTNGDSKYDPNQKTIKFSPTNYYLNDKSLTGQLRYDYDSLLYQQNSLKQLQPVTLDSTYQITGSDKTNYADKYKLTPSSYTVGDKGQSCYVSIQDDNVYRPGGAANNVLDKDVTINHNIDGGSFSLDTVWGTTQTFVYYSKIDSSWVDPKADAKKDAGFGQIFSDPTGTNFPSGKTLNRFNVNTRSSYQNYLSMGGTNNANGLMAGISQEDNASPFEMKNVDAMIAWNKSSATFDSSKLFMGTVNYILNANSTTLPLPIDADTGKAVTVDYLSFGVYKGSDSERNSLKNADNYDWEDFNTARSNGFKDVSSIRFKANDIWNLSGGFLMQAPIKYTDDAKVNGYQTEEGENRLAVATINSDGKQWLQNSDIKNYTGFYGDDLKIQNDTNINSDWMTMFLPPVTVTDSQAYLDNFYMAGTNNQTSLQDNVQPGQKVQERFALPVAVTSRGMKNHPEEFTEAQLKVLAGSDSIDMGSNWGNSVKDTDKVKYVQNISNLKWYLGNQELNLTRDKSLNKICAPVSEVAKYLQTGATDTTFNSSDIEVTPDMITGFTKLNGYFYTSLRFKASAPQLGVLAYAPSKYGSVNSPFKVEISPYTSLPEGDNNIRGIVSLPQNGEDGSDFQGTVAFSNLSTINSNGQTMDYWYSDQYNKDVNPTEDISKDTTHGWHKYTGDVSELANAKSIAYQVEGLSKNSSYKFDITLTPSRNQNLDHYFVRANINSDSDFAVAPSSVAGYITLPVVSPVTLRKVDGETKELIKDNHATFGVYQSALDKTLMKTYDGLTFPSSYEDKLWSVYRYDVDGSGTIDDTDYQLWTSSLKDATFETDDTGKVSFSNVVLEPDFTGTVLVNIKELSAPAGYAVGTNSQVALPGTTVSFDNYRAGSITLNTVNTDGEALNDAVYALYDSNGDKVTQDSDGNTLNITGSPYKGNLPHGNYTLRQVKAPVGYDLYGEEIKVTITSGQDSIIEVVNTQSVSLPETGGSWLPWALTVLASLVMLFSGFWLLNKSDERKQS